MKIYEKQTIGKTNRVYNHTTFLIIIFGELIVSLPS